MIQRGRKLFRHTPESTLCPLYVRRSGFEDRHYLLMCAWTRVLVIPTGGRRKGMKCAMSESGSSSAESMRFPRGQLLLVLSGIAFADSDVCSASSTWVAPDPDPGRSTALRFRPCLLQETPRYRIITLARVCEGDGKGKSCDTALGRESM
jgi:hypothetical protein